MNDTPTRGTEVPLYPLRSDGGLTIHLPEGFEPVFADDHLTAFVGPGDPHGPPAGGDEPDAPAGFATNVVVAETAGRLPLEQWWEGLHLSAEGPLLLEAAENDGGFAATFAQVVNGVSVTGLVAGSHLPGRTLTVTAQVATSRAGAQLPLLARIVASVEVEGLT